MTGRSLAILVRVAIVGVLAAVPLPRHAFGADPTELVVTPEGTRISVRVGDAVTFSVAAEEAAAVTWSLWGRPVSHDRIWSYAPAPADAGWQHVTLTVAGSGGPRVERIWDVGVVAAVAPALLEVLPPQGTVPVAPGERPRFRCGARAAAAGPGDRLQFDWTLDGRPVHRDEGPAATAFSELILPDADAGSHRLAVRVGEGDGVASLAEWTLEVAALAVSTRPAPRATLVPVHGPRRVTAVVGERVIFDAEVAPEPPRTRYDWAVNGRRAQRSPAPRYEYAPTAPGLHWISVAVSAGPKSIGRGAWLLVVAPPR